MWSEPVTDSTGRFTLKLIDNDNTLGGKYAKDDTVTIYADNLNGDTERFVGIVDEVKSDRTPSGQFLIITGKHKAGVLLDILVTKVYPKQDCSDILKDMIDTFANDFTYANVASSTGVNYEVPWSYKPFWDCVKELCRESGYDCYVDNDKGFHFFKKNSTTTVNDAVVHGDNTLRDGIKGFGKDAFYQRNRITIVGQDDEGQPIIYTTPNVTGTVKEKVVNDTSLRTMEQVKARHDQEFERLNIYENLNQGTSKTYALMNTNPGDQIWVGINKIKVLRKYRVLNLQHELGRNVSCKWRTTSTLETKTKDVTDYLKDDIDRSINLQNIENPNNLKYTYNFTFDDEKNIASSPNTHIEGGSLVLDSGQTEGSMTTGGKLNPENADINWVEVRLKGSDLGLAHYYISVTGSPPWQEITLRRLESVKGSGKRIFLKVELKSDDVNTNPKIDSLMCLFVYRSVGVTTQASDPPPGM